MPDEFSIRCGYKIRSTPRYFDTPDRGVTWQPDVYRFALAIAQRTGATHIIDVGCGHGAKLAELQGAVEIVGIDYGPNIGICRARYPTGTWLEHDLETEVPLPLDRSITDDAVIVSADVIEHLRRPDLLLRKLASFWPVRGAILISTPERETWHGVRSAGPPPNECHVREWSVREFQALLTASGFRDHSIGLTRSNDLTDEPNTILALIPGTSTELAPLVSTLIDASPGTPRHSPISVRLRRAARLILRG